MAKDTTTALLAGGATAALLAALIVLVRTHLLPTGHNPVRDAVSDYGVGAHRIYYRVMVVELGVGALLLAVALGRATDVSSGGIVWLVVYGVARIVIAAFPTDPGGTADTVTGRVHLVLAAIAFTAIPLAATTIGSDLDSDPGWGGVDGALRTLGAAVVVTAVATLVARVAPPLRAVAFGAIERLLYLASFAWLLLVAIHLLANSA